MTINVLNENLFLRTNDPAYLPFKYIGSCSNNDPKYRGSSKSLKRDILRDGLDNFVRITLFELIVDDPRQLLVYEKMIQQSFDVVNSPEFYNKALATDKFTSVGLLWGYNTITGEIEKFKKGSSLPENWAWGTGFSPIKGAKAYHNCDGKVTFSNVDLSESGLSVGIPRGNTTGLKWFYNPLSPTERMCGETCPEGWRPGMGDVPNHPYAKTVRLSYHDPKTGKNGRYEEDHQPTGWIRGRKGSNIAGRKWYHDPTSQKRSFLLPSDTIPNGWIAGKGFTSGGRPKGSKNKTKTPPE